MRGLRWSSLVPAAVLRGVVLGLIWLALSGGSADYALYGAVSVAATAALSLVLLPPAGPPRPGSWPRRAWGAASLVGWFLWKSVAGGVDVVARALRPASSVLPVVVSAPVVLPEGPARQLALLMMNLMPGSMVQHIEQDEQRTAQQDGEPQVRVQLHALAADLEPAAQWESLQRRVARAFG